MPQKGYKKTNSLDKIYQEINRCRVRIKNRDRKNNNAILFSVLRELLRIMRMSDPLFNAMKPRLEYLGSYFDGLRVGQPTEYDINIVLKLPINYKNINLDASYENSYDQTEIYMPSEFRRLRSTPCTANLGYSRTSMWCDKEYRLSVEKFRSWMQGVIDLALSKLQSQNDKRILYMGNKYYLIYLPKMSGPALTIKIQAGNKTNNVIDVDLVPTLAFRLPQKPTGSKILFDLVRSTKRDMYFVVPKPSHNKYSWRLAFPFQEKYYIKSKQNLKSALKLIKLLRDTQNFKNLASYYIKTIFLWEVRMQPIDFWKKSLSYLVLHMLKRLRDNLYKGEIQNFWCPDSNLIKGKICEDTCSNWSNRLSLIIKDIEVNANHNPSIISKYFTVTTIDSS